MRPYSPPFRSGRNLRFDEFFGEVDTSPYKYRGEEDSDRSVKWNTGANICDQPDSEKEALRDFCYDHFSSCGIEFEPVNPDPSLYPGDTCPGLPWSKWGFKNKKEVVDFYGTELLTRAGELQIESEQVPLYEFCKCEAQKEGKNVRTILCYPIHVHLAHIKWLIPFSVATKKLPECEIGWNKWQGGIQAFCNKFTKAKHDEGDGEQFDSTLPNIHVRIPIEEYFKCFPLYPTMSSFFDKLIDSILMSLVFSSNGQVYFKDSGNPSGCIVTGEVNSWCNLLAWLTAFMRKYETLSLRDFRKLVQLAVYGDDQKSSHDEGGLCARELEELLPDLTYRFPKDKAKCQDTQEGLTFLGNVFYKLNNIWLWRPAKPKKLYCTLKYTEKRDEEPDLSLELARVRGILVECAWDQKLWNELYPYQCHLETLGATCEDEIVGVHVDRARVTELTFGVAECKPVPQSGGMSSSSSNTSRATKNVACNQCSKRFKTANARSRHNQMVHAAAAQAPRKRRQNAPPKASIQVRSPNPKKQPKSRSQVTYTGKRSNMYKGISREGNLFINSVISCGESNASACRVPDGPSFDTILQSYQLPKFSLAKPTEKVSEDLDWSKVDFWDFAIMLIPSPESPLLVKAWPSTTDEPTWQSPYGINKWVSEAHGTSLGAHMAIFNTKVGIPTKGKYEEVFIQSIDVSTPTKPVLVGKALDVYNASELRKRLGQYRVTGSEVTLTNTTAVIKMGGQISGIQMGRDAKYGNKTVSNKTGDLIPACPGVFLPDVNETSNDLLSSTPSMADHAASEGGYTCIYPNRRSFEFINAEQSRGIFATYDEKLEESQASWFPIEVTESTVGKSLPLITTIDDGWNFGLMVGTGLPGDSVFNLKHKCFVEAVPDPDGPLSATTGNRAPVDTRALELLLAICSELPPMWPASYNDSDGVLQWMGNFWKGFKSFWEPAVGVVGDVVKVLGAL